MGRPRKPTNLLEISGAFKKHPERLADRANEPTGMEELAWEPPGYLSQYDAESWKHLRPKLPPGVAMESDEPAFALLCGLWSKMAVGSAAPPESKQIESILGKFGMTPADRAKVSAIGKPKQNKFAAIG